MAKSFEVMSDLSKKKIITLYKAYVYDLRFSEMDVDLPINTASTRVATTQLGAIRHAFIELADHPDYAQTLGAIANGKLDTIMIVVVTIDIPSSSQPIAYDANQGALDCNYNEAEGWLTLSMTDKEFKLGCESNGVTKIDCDINPTTSQIYVRDIELFEMDTDAATDAYFEDDDADSDDENDIVDDE